MDSRRRSVRARLRLRAAVARTSFRGSALTVIAPAAVHHEEIRDVPDSVGLIPRPTRSSSGGGRCAPPPMSHERNRGGNCDAASRFAGRACARDSGPIGPFPSNREQAFASWPARRDPKRTAGVSPWVTAHPRAYARGSWIGLAVVRRRQEKWGEFIPRMNDSVFS